MFKLYKGMGIRMYLNLTHLITVSNPSIDHNPLIKRFGTTRLILTRLKHNLRKTK